MRPTSDKRGGFTVVELIIAIGIISAIAIGLVSLVVSLVGNATRSIETTKQIRETQSALATIKDDLRLTDKLLTTSSFVSDTDRSGNAWNHRGTFGAEGAGKRTLLLHKRSTSLTGNAQNRQPLYRLVPSILPTYDCVSTDPNALDVLGATTVEPEYSTIIYYLHTGTLYRRIVVQPVGLANYCTGHASAPVRTCADPTSSTKPPNCLERDVVLAQNVTEFDILYYNEPGDAAGDAAIFSSGATQADLDGISTVQITIQTRKDIGGRDNEFTSQIRANRGSEL